MEIQIRFDDWTKDLLWKIAKAKADWFRENGWKSKLDRFLKFGLSMDQAEQWQQFLGLCGEAAVWHWLWGDLGEFWEQQAFLHETKALSDGGQDMPGLDVKTRDLIYHDHHSQPDLFLTPTGINPEIYYVLCVVLISQPVMPLELDVVISGAISGRTVLANSNEWFDDKLKRTVISQEFLTPVQTLKWNEHVINKRKGNG